MGSDVIWLEDPAKRMQYPPARRHARKLDL